MKLNIAILFLVLLLGIQLSAVDVNADEIFFSNGDQITGKIINMKEGKLLVSTPYSDNISVAWDHVTAIQSDDPIRLILDDETDIKGVTKEGEKGKLSLKTDSLAGTVTVNLTKVRSINPPGEPAVKLKGQLNMGLTSVTGNTESESHHVDGEFIARTYKNRYTVGAAMNRGEDDGEETVNNSLGYLKYDHFITGKTFLYSNAFFEKDKFKDLNLRTALGLGAGYQVLEEPSINLSVEAGLAYINEDLENDPDNDYQSGRWAVNFDKYLVGGVIQFFHFHEGFVGFEDTSDIFVRSRTGLRVPVYKSLSASFQFNYDWDKKPSTGRKKSDSMYIFNLGYQFGN